MLRTTFLLAWATFAFTVMEARATPFNNNFITFDGPGDNAGGTTVNGVSNTGAIAGFSSNASLTVFTNFVRNPGGTLTTLNIDGDPLANANGINSAGLVVGATGGQGFVMNAQMDHPAGHRSAPQSTCGGARHIVTRISDSLN